MKMVVVNDIHLAAKTPISRKGDYTQDILAKLDEIVDFVVENEVGILAFTGDIFHDKGRTPYWLVYKFLNSLNRLSGVVKIAAIGNHDWDENIDEFYRFPAYFAFVMGCIGYKPHSGIVTFLVDIPNVCEYAVAVLNSDKTKTSELAVSEIERIFEHKKDRRIVLFHGPVVPPQLVNIYPTALMEKAINPELLAGHADFIFYGDIHDFHGAYKIGDTTFCNMGSLARNTAHEIKRERSVSVALFDSIDGSIQQVELENVRSIDEAFRLVDIMLEKDKQEEIEAFVESLGTAEFAVLTKEVLRSKVQESVELNEEEKRIAIEAINSVPRD